MMATTFDSFEDVHRDIHMRMRHAPLVHPPRWQSVDVSDNPNLATHELLNYSFSFQMPIRTVDAQETIKPNLPWAEDHFQRERVGGDPLNPGKEWRNWPYARSADTHRREGEEDPQFDHSYAERYWPKYAGKTKGGILLTDKPRMKPHPGIRFRYGDLNDLVDLLAREPLTRQAYLPVWFPEDLGAIADGKRVPCSLGYHFIVRDNRLHIVYYLRSCDFVRHFRDDVYMTVRLAQWVLGQCKLASTNVAGVELWDEVLMGTFTMHITSLHIFKADYRPLFGKT